MRPWSNRSGTSSFQDDASMGSGMSKADGDGTLSRETSLIAAPRARASIAPKIRIDEIQSAFPKPRSTVMDNDLPADSDGWTTGQTSRSSRRDDAGWKVRRGSLFAERVGRQSGHQPTFPCVLCWPRKRQLRADFRPLLATRLHRALSCLSPPQVAICIHASMKQFGVSEYSATDSPGYEHSAVS